MAKIQSSRLTNPRFFLIYPLVFWVFLTAYTTEPSLRVGILLVSLGEAFRLWANGYVGHVKVKQLITAGPYGFMRHPLYFGSLLIGVGICVIVGHLWLSVIALGSLFLVYRRQMLKEEGILLREWGAEYERYRQCVPRYGFAWRQYPHPQGQWSPQGIAASKEWKTVAWVTIVLIGLYFREEFWQEREFFPAKERVKHVVLLAVALLLIITDGLFELRRRGFFEKLKSYADQLKREIQVYQRVLRHPRTPKLAKWFLGLAVGYALLPFDLIPDFIPVIGQLDDLIIIPALVILALKMIPKSVIEECRQAASFPAGRPAPPQK